MSLPEKDSFAKYGRRNCSRRVLLRLSVAAITFSIGVWLSGYQDRTKVVRSSISTTYTMESRLVELDGSAFPFTHNYELFPSPDGAAEEFEFQLHEAGDYRDIRACHDQDGTAIGKGALLINPGRRTNATSWRIVWFLRGESSSELFSLTSNSLPNLRIAEHVPRPNWKLCL